MCPFVKKIRRERNKYKYCIDVTRTIMRTIQFKKINKDGMTD